MVDIGSISFYLGLKVYWDRKKKTFKLFQPEYIDKILAKIYFDQIKTSNTPIKEALLTLNEKKKATLTEQECYQEMTGSVIFSIV